jgi:hypothetical protein
MPRSTTPFSSVTATRHRVQEFMCAYRPLRDAEGHVVSLPTLVLNNPETAARALTPLLAQEPVEVFAIACLSAGKRLHSWHLYSRGTRTGTQVSMPDVLVPAVLTPGTNGLHRPAQPPQWRAITERGRRGHHAPAAALGGDPRARPARPPQCGGGRAVLLVPRGGSSGDRSRGNRRRVRRASHPGSPSARS